MSTDRRKFLKAAGMLASGFAISSIGCNTSTQKEETSDKKDSAQQTSAVAAGTALSAFGLQLYSLRDDLPKDPKGVLKQVASFGYKQVESFEGKQGMFWGMSNTEFKKYMDELGMTIVSSHCDINKDFEKKAAQAGEIGMKYLICPYIGPQKKLDDYKKHAEKFNQCGEICKKNGLRFAYHNHDYTFKEQEGQMPQDVLMQHTSADTVDYEMDIYWVVTPGADPEAWLKKYASRFRLCHVKDRMKDAKPGDHDASCDVGTGVIDFAKVLKTASENGMQYYIVEQERYDNSTPLKSAEADAAYLKKLLI
jgi:sugar phosphate isomerase/epimerase